MRLFNARWIVSCAAAFVIIAGSTVAVGSEPGTSAPDGGDVGCEVATFFGGLQCVDSAGEAQWQILHPSGWKDIQGFHDDVWKLLISEDELVVDDDVHLVAGDVDEPAGPVTVDGRLFYAVQHDLLEVDETEGRIVDRTRFPGHVSALAPGGDDRLKLTLQFSEDGVDEKRFQEVTYRVDGPPPAQTPWTGSRSGFVNARHDASGLHWSVALDGFQNEIDTDAVDDDVEVDKRIDTYASMLGTDAINTVVRRLEAARRRDPTNPFFSLFIGTWQQARGADQKAREAFLAAAEADAVWRDLLDLSTALDDRGAHEAARRAWERGVQRLDASGIARERFSSVARLTTVFLHRPRADYGGPIREALEEGDAETVHRLSLRYADVFPYVEGGAHAWRALADWMENHDRPEWADQWRTRADANDEQGCGFGGPDNRRVVAIDRGVLALATAGAGLAILLLLIGVRLGRARRRDAEPGDASPERLSTIGELSVIGMLVAALLGVPLFVNAQVQSIGQLASFPVELLDDGLASPLAKEHLETMTPSPARDRLLTIVESEHRAFVEGRALPEKENLCPLINDAVDAESNHRQMELLREGRLVHPVVDFEQSTAFQQEADRLRRLDVPTAVGGLLGLVVVWGVGVLIGRFLPGPGRWLLRIVPGGAIRPVVVGDIAVVLFAGSVLALLGLDSILQSTTLGVEANYLELEALVDDLEPETLNGWAWGVAAMVVVAHVGAVVRDIGGESDRK